MTEQIYKGEKSLVRNEQSFFATILSVLFFCAAILHLLYVLIPFSALQLIYSAICFILLACAFFNITSSSRILSLILIGTGTYIFITNDVSFTTVLASFGHNMNVLTLFLLVPLFGLMMSEGGYLKALKEYVAHHKQLVTRPYHLSNVLTAIMGMFLNLGTVPIVYHMAKESFSSFHRIKMTLVIQRAFGFCAFWSPYFVSVGLVISLLNVNWSELVWPGLTCGLVYLLIAIPFNRWLRFDHDQLIGKSDQTPKEAADLDPAYRRKTGALFLWTAALFILSMTLDAMLPISMLTIVSLLALVFPLVWAAVLRALPGYIKAAQSELSRSYMRLSNELTIFISAGFFGVAVSHTSLGVEISELILSLSFGSLYILSLLVVLSTVILALVGIHPVIVLIGVGSSFQPELFGMEPTYMAVLLLIGWSLATQLSPFSGSVLMTASLTQTSPWLLTRKNLLFVLVHLLVLPLVLYTLFHLF